MEYSSIIGLVVAIISLIAFCCHYFVLVFKVSYYRQKLENRLVDTSHIDKINIIGILKL